MRVGLLALRPEKQNSHWVFEEAILNLLLLCQASRISSLYWVVLAQDPLVFPQAQPLGSQHTVPNGNTYLANLCGTFRGRTVSLSLIWEVSYLGICFSIKLKNTSGYWDQRQGGQRMEIWSMVNWWLDYTEMTKNSKGVSQAKSIFIVYHA